VGTMSNPSRESFDQIQVISVFLGKRSLAMRYSTKQACIDLRKTVQFKFVAVACRFFCSMSDVSHQSGYLFQGFIRFVHKNSL
jgi:hypothetical protein